jgi:hypothetical protein
MLRQPVERLRHVGKRTATVDEPPLRIVQITDAVKRDHQAQPAVADLTDLAVAERDAIAEHNPIDGKIMPALRNRAHTDEAQ